MTIGQLARMSGRAALVLRKLEINEAGPHYVHIEGRKAGLMSWLCNFVGVDATTVFDVYEEAADSLNHVTYTAERKRKLIGVGQETSVGIESGHRAFIDLEAPLTGPYFYRADNGKLTVTRYAVKTAVLFYNERLLTCISEYVVDDDIGILFIRLIIL